MSEHSILTPIHELGDGMYARVVRVLRDTRTSTWGGTMAYKTGIDVLVTVHCASCCCMNVSEPATCGSKVGRELRVEYGKPDGEAWFRRAQERAREHLVRHSGTR